MQHPEHGIARFESHDSESLDSRFRIADSVPLRSTLGQKDIFPAFLTYFAPTPTPRIYFRPTFVHCPKTSRGGCLRESEGGCLFFHPLLCTLRAATVLSRDCRVGFGRPLTKKVMSHSRDGPGGHGTNACETPGQLQGSKTPNPCSWPGVSQTNADKTMYLSPGCGIPPPPLIKSPQEVSRACPKPGLPHE